ncbi:exported hypothetical protein [Vibrio coralliirubri]|uniref:outer membrane beta-barrel protein n=1 Tax=Vibrio coralliirubri TaxID=1516159 RepID=UPI000636224C|nr:outer membrane beta-barrel protein [Vibrio coralliirubri]CDT53314.1 exported hypothetical protein [Vibrio coralliirubri]
MKKQLIATAILMATGATLSVQAETLAPQAYVYGGTGVTFVDDYKGNPVTVAAGFGHEIDSVMSVEVETTHLFNRNQGDTEHLWNLSIAGKFDYAINQNFDLFTKVGFNFQHIDWDCPTCDSNRDFKPALGLGAEYTTDDQDHFIRLQYNFNLTDFELDNYSSLMLMAGYRF